MQTNLKCSLWLVAIVSAASCGDGAPDVDCSGTIPSYADVAALEKCTMCHSSQLSGSARKNAPSSVNYDTEAAADANASKGASEVNSGSMPPSNSGIALTDEEKQTLYKWATCR